MASGRALRPRQAVNYNVQKLEAEAAVTPSWLKSKNGGEKENKPARAAPKKRKSSVKDSSEAKPAVVKKQKALAPKPAKFAAPEANEKKTKEKKAKEKKVKERRVKKDKPKKAAQRPKYSEMTPIAYNQVAESCVSEDHTISVQMTPPEVKAMRKKATTSRMMINPVKEPVSMFGGNQAVVNPGMNAGKTQVDTGMNDVENDHFSHSAAFQELLDQYNDVKNKYTELKASRMSHIRSILEEQSQNVLKHTEASERLVKHWKNEAYKQAELVQSAVGDSMRDMEQKMVQLTQRKDELERELDQTKLGYLGKLERLEDENARLKSEMDATSVKAKASCSDLSSPLMSVLTGMDVLKTKDDCYRMTHLRTGYSFEMSGFAKDKGDGDIRYLPVSLGTIDTKLPDYLKEEIFFDLSQAPILFPKILSIMNN